MKITKKAVTFNRRPSRQTLGHGQPSGQQCKLDRCVQRRPSAWSRAVWWV